MSELCLDEELFVSFPEGNTESIAGLHDFLADSVFSEARWVEGSFGGGLPGAGVTLALTLFLAL